MNYRKIRRLTTLLLICYFCFLSLVYPFNYQMKGIFHYELKKTILEKTPSKKELEKDYNLAMKFLNNEDYEKALNIFKELLNVDPTNANFNFYAGICLIKLSSDKIKARQYFEKASSNVTPKYINSYSQKKAPINAYYYLGLIYQYNGDCKNALDKYNRFKSFINASNEEENDEVLNDIRFQMDLCKKSLNGSSDSEFIKEQESKKFNEIEKKKIKIKDVNDVKRYYKEAIILLDKDDFDKALSILIGLQEKDTSNENIKYLVAVCYFNLSMDKMKALQILAQMEANIDPYYKSVFDEKKSPPRLLYYMGLIYQYQDNCEKALSYYKKYKIYLDKKDNDLISEINWKIDLCNISVQNVTQTMGADLREEKKETVKIDSVQTSPIMELKKEEITENIQPTVNSDIISPAEDTTIITASSDSSEAKPKYIEIDSVKKQEKDTTNLNVNKTASKNIIVEEKHPLEKITNLTSVNMIVYRIQIASLNNDLATGYFKRKYNLKQKIYVNSSDGTYKYSIGEFLTYDEAANFNKSLQPALENLNSFVIGFKDGIRFIPDQEKH